MADVLRIIDQFQLEGKGVLYTVKKNKNVVIGVDDVYYDLQRNRFRVVCIEMVRRTPNETNSNNEPVGIVLESLDYADVCGILLVSKLNEINFLFCNHPLYKDRVDEDYESEYQIANQKYNCALFSYEDLEQRRLSMYGQEIKGLTIYRGWMMKSEMYRTFYSLLEERGIILINSPEEYERYHYIPGWYDDF